MPSWSTWSPSDEKKTTPPANGTAAAVARARRLLEQLFSGKQRDDRPRPKH